MSVQADAITLKKLALTKQIFNRAVIHNNSLSNVDKLMSIIEFDLSTETVLNAVVKSLNPQKTPSDGFPALLNQTDSVLIDASLGNVPDRGNILHVHKIRNDAQHDARYPNPNELSDCHTYTKDFLKKIVQLVWNLDFDRISMADLIQHQEIKTHLKNGEDALSSADYKTTVEQAITGLQKALNRVGRSVVGQPTLSTFTKVVTTDLFGRNQRPDDNILKTMEKMQDTLRLLSLGLNYLDYMKFKEITGTPLFTIGNTDPVSFIGTKTNLTADDAEYALAYAIDSIIMIENKVGNIDSPFGRDAFSWR